VDADYLLDASALLAFLRREPGWDFVLPVLNRSVITSVNLYEVLAKAAQVGIGWERAAKAIRSIGLLTMPFSEEHVDGGRKFAKPASVMPTFQHDIHQRLSGADMRSSNQWQASVSLI
jgi:PIN domain nuclease of toxin-antitoxin system